MKLKNKAIEFISRAALPIMLACVIVNMIVRCYYIEMRLPFTALYGVCAVGLFLLFDFLKKHKILGFFAYVAILAGVVYISTRFSWRGWQETHIIFTDWFYLDRNTAGFSLDYFLYIYIFGGFFLTSIIYYFTQMRFRSLGLMLCLLFPFVIYAKRADIMSNFDVTLIITLFLAIVVHNRQLFEKQENIRQVKDVPYYVSIALFVSFAGAVAMLIPKPEVRSVLERDSHAFDINANAQNSNDYSTYSMVSSKRYGASYTNKILFYAESSYSDGENVFFLKRQAFDGFHDDQWRRELEFKDYDYSKGYHYDRAQYYSVIKKLAESGRYADYGLTDSTFSMKEPIPYVFRVYDDEDTFHATYLPTPNGVIGSSYNKSGDTPYYLYSDGEIIVKNRDRKYDYTVDFYPETDDIVNNARNIGMTFDQYYDMLIDAKERGISGADDLLEQYESAFDNYTGNIEYSDRMRDLAFEITKDCKSDYDKAKALCDYFENNGFTYDLAYEPDDTSIDYFLFEGKTGVCTSFATSMALMARIVGLPARYVEGFVAYERDKDEDRIVVRDAHAHAYVEIYIPCAGWVTFDPTIAGYTSALSGDSGFSLAFLRDYLSRVFVFVIVLLFVFVIIMFDRIAEFVFRIRQHFVKGDKRIIRLYARTVRLLEQSSDEDLSAYTTRMISNLAEKYNNADVGQITLAFERTCFGGVPLDDETYEKIYTYYKSIYPMLRKRPKPNNSQLIVDS